jgi:Tfp pilus assembly protein FimT
MSPVVLNLRLRGAAWQVAGDLRLARQRAVTLKKRFQVCVTGCAVGVSAGSYSIERDDGTPSAPNWVSDTNVATTLPQDVTISTNAASGAATFTVFGAANSCTVTLTNPIGTYQVAVAQPGRVRVCPGACPP